MSIVGPTEVSVSWNVAPVSSDPITYEIKYTLVNSGNPPRTETITSSMATVTKTISGKFVVVVLFVLLLLLSSSSSRFHQVYILDGVHFCNFLFTFNNSMCRSDAKKYI